MGNPDNCRTPPKVRVRDIAEPFTEDEAPESDESRPTVVPPYDVQRFAHDSESGLRAVSAVDRPDGEGGVVEDVRGLMAAGEHEEALACANTALAMAPMHKELRGLALECTETLERRYTARLGGPLAVLVVTMPASELKAQAFDTVTGFLLAQLDGLMTLEDVIDVCGLPRLTVLRALGALADQGIVEAS